MSSFDLTGGAGKAAYRLSQGLRDQGVDLHMDVQSRSGDASWVSESLSAWRKSMNRLRPTLDRLPLRVYRSYGGTPWSTNLMPRRVPIAPGSTGVQIVHLHWVGYGFVPISSLRQWNVPIVWTLHDSWAFTGGCHVPGDCRRYTESCGRCPQLGSKSSVDLSRFIWQRKASNWNGVRLTTVAPSQWLASAARESALMRHHDIHVIPNGLDLALFRPIDPDLCRSLLQLPMDKKLIVFGAVSPFGDPNKGFSHLREAIEILAAGKDSANFELVIFGASALTKDGEFALPTRCLGPIRDELKMAMLLSAADVTVVPSRSENLSNTIMESLACGTPVACFDIGGNGDMVDHRESGYLARPFDAGDLARGIRWITDAAHPPFGVRQKARAKCERDFSIERVAQRHVALYESLLKQAAAER
ncbi:MAG: glycosyltransferase [Rhizobacter sp.]